MITISKLLLPNGDDYPEAAEKHLEDAHILIRSGRYDGAGYHAGYVMECILKTCIQLTRSPCRGHNLNSLNRQALLLAAQPTARTARYFSQNWNAAKCKIIKAWNPTIRYRSSGHIKQHQAEQWMAEVVGFYHSTIPKMKLDGEI